MNRVKRRCPHESVSAIGIDLGTTNSVVAVSQSGQPEVICDEHGVALLPSVVAYDDDGGATVGAAAERIAARPAGPCGVVDQAVDGAGAPAISMRLPGRCRYDVAEDDEYANGMVRLSVAGRASEPGRNFRRHSARHPSAGRNTRLGRDVTQAVITVPAYFDDARAHRDQGRR